MIFAPTLSGQEGFTLRWDSEVGCLNYDEDRKDRIPLEEISDDNCLLVCEGSQVNFELIFDHSQHDVESILWEPENGVLNNTSNNDTSASITWPNPTENAGVSILIVLENGEEIFSTICIKVKPKPDVKFIVDQGINQFFCSHIDIDFENISEAADGYQIVANHWDFGDGSTSNAENPVHSYDHPGNYEVILTVYDECGCSNFYTETITVTEPGLEISCPTVTCEGSIETYSIVGTPYTDERVECRDYQWFVEGGHIVNQQGDWVNVIWDDVDENGFGYLHFDQNSCNVKCQSTLVAKIPVVTKKGIIKGGKTSFCQGEQSTYKLPQWPTTDFEWRVYDGAGNIYPNAVVLKDQRNEVVVDSDELPAGNYILRSDYTNTLLQCGGEAEFRFNVKPNLEIDAPITKACTGEQMEFHLVASAVGAQWEATRNGQIVAQGSGNHFQPTFTESGNYRISVQAPGKCTATTTVQIYKIPQITSNDIQGPDEVCPGQQQIYSFVGNTHGFDIIWDIQNGEILGPDQGDKISVIFDENHSNYAVNVQLVNSGLSHCTSDVVTKSVLQYHPDVEIVNTANNSSNSPQTFCSSNSAEFTLDYPSENYNWFIEPNRLGQVSQNTQNTDTPTILFNEPYLDESNDFIEEGTIYVEARVCGKMEIVASMDFSLLQAPDLTIIDAPNKNFSISKLPAALILT